MEKIWLVYGMTGEYSAHENWPVAAYANKDNSDEHARLANEHVKPCGVFPNGYPDKVEYDISQVKKIIESNQYDTQCRIDYTGTAYSVIEIPMPADIAAYIRERPPVPRSFCDQE